MTTNTNPFRIGQRVQWVSHPDAGAPPFATPVGTVETVKAHQGPNLVMLAERDRLPGENPLAGGERTVNVSWLEPVPAKPRPEIDWSGDSRATVRGYAADLRSRVNKAETEAILNAIEHGEPVDAYAVAACIPDVLSGVATRFGQSRARREATRKARAIAYIAHAVLANHAAGLPVYAEGQRSRLIEEAKEALRAAEVEMNHQRTVNQNLAQDLTAERGKTAQVRNRLAEAEEAARQARLSKQAANEERDAAEARLAQAIAERDDARKAARENDDAAARAIEWEQRAIAAADHNDQDADLLTYALGLLDATQRARFEGFKDAVRR